jgi:hypothetical protein
MPKTFGEADSYIELDGLLRGPAELLAAALRLKFQ